MDDVIRMAFFDSLLLQLLLEQRFFDFSWDVDCLVALKHFIWSAFWWNSQRKCCRFVCEKLSRNAHHSSERASENVLWMQAWKNRQKVDRFLDQYWFKESKTVQIWWNVLAYLNAPLFHSLKAKDLFTFFSVCDNNLKLFNYR